MKIAVPTKEGIVAMHFGHCEKFAIVEVDRDKKAIVQTEYLPPPQHEPGVLPKWLREQGVDLVIAGGMGARAQQMFARFGIEAVVGAAGGSAEDVAKKYLQGELAVGENACDH